jgi:hypothetical protein
MWAMTPRRALPLLLAGLLAGGLAPAARAAQDDAVAYDAREQDPRDAPLPAGTQRERRELARELGRDGVIDIDPATGTPRVVVDLDGALTGPSEDGPAAAALAYVRANAAAFGLTDADLAGLRLRDRATNEDGLTVLRWIQVTDGIPAFDSGLKVAVDRAGRVVSVSGSPAHGLDVASADPGVTATAALDRVRRRFGGRDTRIADASGGARQATEFADGSRASLVAFAMAGADQLAWDVLAPSPVGLMHAVIDATSGRVLFHANLTDDATNADVFENHPGAAAPITVDLDPWLTDGTKLKGPNAHTFADLDDDNVADGPEEVTPGTFTFQDFNTGPVYCTSGFPCSWDSSDDGSWQTNLEQNANQVFYFVNVFHDHLKEAPIGFDADSGNFEGDDYVLAQSDDGAATDPGFVPGAPFMPDVDHTNNANMSTPPDGFSPTMQMYLFSNVDSTRFRDVNGGDSAAIVYHEYTHGLSNRLVTDAAGYGALDGAQSGAMGEAWSDWYAMDFLVREGIVTDNPGVDGDVDVGAYVDAVPHTIRYQGIDCAVDASAGECPAPDGDAGFGGFTYGDFGDVFSGPEVHADGEIWAQTLWDLRRALVAHFGGSDSSGSTEAERLITDGMRLSPPEPTFLDMRNAILAGATSDTLRDIVWQVFAARGMGFFAAATDASDTFPVEDFSLPPAAGGPTGTVTGRVYDAVSGLPRPATSVGFGGHTTFAGPFMTTTGGDGNYSLTGLPEGTYPQLFTTIADGFDAARVSDVPVDDAEPAVRDFAVRRDWAAFEGGGRVTVPANPNTTCGPFYAIDHSQAVGWSAENPDPEPDDPDNPGVSMVVELPQAITVTSFAIDPGATCGDGASATLKNYRLETSPTGEDGTWTIAKDARTSGGFTGGEAGTMVPIDPEPGSTENVKFVRLTLYEPQSECSGCSGEDWIDISELAVYGAPPNQLPSGTLAVTPSPAPVDATVTLDASGITDPDSLITGYRWDLDGNGTIDRTTTSPTTTSSYATAGSYTAAVTADDFRGGSFTAQRAFEVAATPVPPAPVPTPRAPAISLKGPRRPNAVTVTIVCQSACRGAASLRITAKQAKRLGLRKFTVGAKGLKLSAGRHVVRIPLTKPVLRKLRKKHTRFLRVRLALTLTDASGLKRKASGRPRVAISRK